jgi:hypothetical protein
MLKRIMKWIALGLLGLILIALLVYAFLPKVPCDPMEYTDLTKTEKQLRKAGEFAVGAIMIGENGELLAGADPREETTALGK